MKLLLLGLSHRTAPVEVRERYAVAPARLAGLDEKLASDPACSEAALISTCNRTEIVVAAHSISEASERMLQLFTSEIGDGSAQPSHLYELGDREVVLHLFRVASSLDSMVLGEAQILGQLKDAYRAAVAAGSCGPILNRLFHRTFRTAKRVRSETGLGASLVSVARVGVQLASEVFETLEDKRVLLIGAGAMAESALQGLLDAGARDVVIVNRTAETARLLARRFAARAAPFSALESELGAANVALASAQVQGPLLGRAALARCMAGRAGDPLLLIDLGMPRNVEPTSNQVDDVYLYDLDDLDELAERGRVRRRGAVAPAEALVQAEVDRYLAWLEGLDAVPTIRELLDQAQGLARDEARRAAKRLQGAPDGEQEVERMAQAIVAKLLHGPLTRLRREAEEGRGLYYALAVRELFGLSEEED